MTQAQFFQAVAEGSQVSKAQVRAVFAAVEDVVMKRLKGEGKIPLGGLGAVKLVDRKARIGRNPRHRRADQRSPPKTVAQDCPGPGAQGRVQQEGEEVALAPAPALTPVAHPRGGRFFRGGGHIAAHLL